MKIQVIHGRVDPARTQRRAYTYETTDESVKPGDLVEVPGNWLVPEPHVATVVAIGSDYDGPLVPIIGIVEQTKEETP